MNDASGLILAVVTLGIILTFWLLVFAALIKYVFGRRE